ncbi:MAG: hypothetical protein AB7N76_01545 [Planctomycetota bacterium]
MLLPRNALFDPSNPFAVPSAGAQSIRFEAGDGEVLGDGDDDDGDYLIDEGRVALYDGAGNLRSVLGQGVTGFSASLTTPATPGSGLPRLVIRLTVERVMWSAVTDPNELAGGGGPRSRHEVRVLVPITN